MTTITKEWLQQTIAEFENTRDDIPFGLNDDDAKILIVLKRALAALTAEPVAWTDAEELRDLRTFGFCEMFTVEPVSKDADMYRVIPLYTVSQPVPERERIRREHAEWSDATFGDVGPIGPLKHLSKEALETAAEPGDLSEWADMQFLLWDAQCRAGITDEQIALAMVEKLAVNKKREWPEPKDGEPRLHIKEQSAPVIPDGWISCRERMPEQGAYISAVSRHGEYVAGQVIDDWLDLHDGTSFGLDEVYLWMMLPPLPAAPQKEVK
ncbi:dATP/dGTP pyrophosphohydrolase domain-containing protein [Salmonella bongori]|uniref:dATP/dGTP pyrophosphohydrolase domain-containing protein n=1 Tax=Salmonella bongori TaxID=54736 RepID=UPI0009AAD483|nr:dATP/dGTP pyrophosphohydrolase domain-containing protein [Salmonella bongori]